MGQAWSTWYRGLVPYENKSPLLPIGPVGPDGLRDNHIEIMGFYGHYVPGEFAYFCYYENDPDSLLRQLVHFDMVGYEIDFSIINKRVWAAYHPVYSEKYKGLVPYYISCERLRAGGFRRPRRIDTSSRKTRPPGEVEASEPELKHQDIFDKKRV
ncbi:hypothetical protein TWF481_011025 [Arthrobotrys musiformis]|uniref:Uncharacterized protein n=1 Tax=Arthrobotrys musiformis TaxID=47236 RepID=A0AAV9VZ12_9PEZI